MKEKFCPLLSTERADGRINKVDCHKRCALYVDGQCGLLQNAHKDLYHLQLSMTNQRLDTVIAALKHMISFKK